jgi:hypothetical protein
MVFFANTGTCFPNLTAQTRTAGAQVLEAISNIWGYFATLERDDGKSITRASVINTAQELDTAAAAYYQIASTLISVRVPQLTAAELTTAAVPQGLGSDAEQVSAMVYSQLVEIGYLYREVAQRSQGIATALRALAFDREIEDLAPQVFSIMRQIELLTSLGRIIAVLNRRTPQNFDSDI